MSPTATWTLGARVGGPEVTGAPMAPQEVMRALAYDASGASQHAFAEAVRQREAMVPLLLAELEHAASDPAAALALAPSYVGHVCVAYLLAQFREPRAFGPLLRCLRLPAPTIDTLFGSLMDGELGAIVASVAHGRYEALYALAEDREACDMARITALDALVVAVIEGDLPRGQCIAFLRRWRARLGPDDVFLVTCLVIAAQAIHPRELMPEIRAAFAHSLVDLSIIERQDVEEACARDPQRHRAEQRETIGYVRDAAASVSQWRLLLDDESPDAPDAPFVTVPYERAQPKIGRNDPCPCGSGKKYKKCCMEKS